MAIVLEGLFVFVYCLTGDGPVVEGHGILRV